jgi:Trk K+ transport system NAD-binding subunit
MPALGRLGDVREYTVEMQVEPGSPLVGRTIGEEGLRQLPGMYLMEIERDGQILPAVSPRERLHGGDRLVFVGIVESVVDLQRMRGLIPATNQVFKLNAPQRDRILVEAVVSNTCPLVGRRVREGRFRSRYNAVIIAVARNRERLKGKIGDIVLRTGDTLLLEARPSFIVQQRNSPTSIWSAASTARRPRATSVPCWPWGSSWPWCSP